MDWLRVKNWEEHQHYKDRCPPWIKVHRSIMDDYEFACLQDASKAHLMLIWVFASQHEGRVPHDPTFLKNKLGLKKEPDLTELIAHGFLIAEHDASKPLADRKQSAPLEETESYKTEETDSAPALPDWLPVDEWKGYCQHRGTKFSARAKKLAIAELDKFRLAGHDPAAILNASVMNGWKGLFEPKPKPSVATPVVNLEAKRDAERLAALPPDDRLAEIRKRHAAKTEPVVSYQAVRGIYSDAVKAMP